MAMTLKQRGWRWSSKGEEKEEGNGVEAVGMRAVQEKRGGWKLETGSTKYESRGASAALDLPRSLHRAQRRMQITVRARRSRGRNKI